MDFFPFGFIACGIAWIAFLYCLARIKELDPAPKPSLKQALWSLLLFVGITGGSKLLFHFLDKAPAIIQNAFYRPLGIFFLVFPFAGAWLCHRRLKKLRSQIAATEGDSKA